MIMSVEKIIGEWKKQKFKPVYWLEGEEDFFIDQVVNYAEHNLLSEAESAFNKTVFYGKDANWRRPLLRAGDTRCSQSGRSCY